MSSKTPFILHPQLAADSTLVCRLDLCQIRMINDANYPWFILVPEQNDLSELHHLSLPQQQLLTNESRILSLAIYNCFAPDKLNIASIGNMVPQLHMHHIARFTNDIAWPKPVWGFASMRAFEPEEYSRRVNAMALEIPKQRHLFA